MRAGLLRHRVVLKYKVVTRDTFGEEDITWTALDTVWAAVEPLRGLEFYQVERAGAEVTTRIRLRYRDDVYPTMRAVWGGHTYDIESVIHVETRGRELHLLCREAVTA